MAGRRKHAQRSRKTHRIHKQDMRTFKDARPLPGWMRKLAGI